MQSSRRRFTVGAAGLAVGLGAIPFAQAQTPSTDPQFQKAISAAEAEGALVLAGPVIQPYREALQQFSQAYPKIRLEYNAVTSPTFDARISSEHRARRSVTDVVVLGFSGAAFSQQIPAGWFDPLRPLIVDPDVVDDAHWLGGFAAGFLDQKKAFLYAFQAGKQNNIHIDRQAVSTAALGKLSDMLDPQWRGKIAILDPRERGSGHLVTLMIKVLGEDKARAFLVDQKPVIASSNRQLSDWIAQGAYPITSGLSPSEVAALQKQGLAKSVQALELPPEQTAWTPGWGALGLLHGAPHPNAAKVFVNWLLSKQAQTQWSHRGLVNSRRKDVSPGLPASALTEVAFRQGLSFNTEANVAVVNQAATLAKDVLG